MSNRDNRIELLMTVNTSPIRSRHEYIRRVKAANAFWLATHSHRLKYLRDGKDHPIGCLIIYDEVNLTASLCHPEDRWNRELAFFHAVTRDPSIIDMVNGTFTPGIPLRARREAHSFVSEYLLRVKMPA